MEIKVFDDANEEIMALRRDVFIVEKHVSEEDELDGRESEHTHFCIYDNDKLISCLRSEDVGNKMLHIGRVAVRKEFRGKGIGKTMLEYVFEYAKNNGFAAVEVVAMDSAEGFYKKLGFVAEGDFFIDAGSPHIYMKKIL